MALYSDTLSGPVLSSISITRTPRRKEISPTSPPVPSSSSKQISPATSPASSKVRPIDTIMRRYGEPTKNLNSSDPGKVKKALENLSPEAILGDLESPERPPWAEAFEDWVDVAMPSTIFDRWSALQGDRSDDNWYYEYDRAKERLRIRAVPTASHDSTSWVFHAQAFREIGQLSRLTRDQLIIGETRRFKGFDFPGLAPNRAKEPDGYLKLRGREFPLIVLEAGWAEREQELINDAQLWLHGTFGLVTFVVIITFTESKDLRLQQGEADKTGYDEGEVEGQLTDGTAIGVDNDDDSEGSYYEMRKLARRLQELEKDGKLVKPLLGSVEARLCLYRRCREDDPEMGIKLSDNVHQEGFQVFLEKEAKVFPKADPDVTMPWGEVLVNEAGGVPIDDLKKNMVLSPKGFEDGIEEALPDMIKGRALERASMLLERHGRYVPGPTFSQLKRGVRDGDGDYVPSQESEAEGGQAKKRKTS